MAKNYEQVVVLLSGGIVDTTILALMVKQYGVENVHAVAVDYGQNNSIKELKASVINAHAFKVKYTVLNLETFIQIDMLFGHEYVINNTSSTIPIKNLIISSIVLYYAIKYNIGNIALNFYSGSNEIYNYQKPVFIDILRSIGRIIDKDMINIITPFLFNNMTEIIKKGLELNIDYIYAYTWACCMDDKMPCHKCPLCIERAEAFANNKISDPLMNLIEAVNNGLNDKEVM